MNHLIRVLSFGLILFGSLVFMSNVALDSHIYTGTLTSGHTEVSADHALMPLAVDLSVSVSEGIEDLETEITVTATAAGAVTGDQTIDVTVSGPGITSLDYMLSSTTITILDGESSATVSFTIQDDVMIEGDEVATLMLTNPSAGLTLGTTTSTDITIIEFRPYITTWETTAAGESITVPITGTTYTIDWGDGLIETNQTGAATHAYLSAGVHTISIYGNSLAIRFNGQGDKDKILTIEQWGDIVWTNMNDAYNGCSNLKITSVDVPDLSDITAMREMFRGATNFEGNIGAWNVEGITNMQNMFFRSGMPMADYDSLLIGWAAQDLQPGVSFNGGSSTYCAGASARANMIDTTAGDGWTILDGGISVTASISGQDGFIDLGIDPVVTFVGSGGTAPYTFTYYVNGGSNMSVTSSGDTALVTQSSAIADTFTYNLVSVSDATGCIQVEIDNASTDIVAYLELRPFITTWETTAAGESITVPISGTAYTIDWGDGLIETNQTVAATHAYLNAGVHTISIYGDSLAIKFNGQGDKDKILTIEQWGDIVWTTMIDAYNGCSNLKITSEDAPDLSMVTSLREMFRGATNFEGNIGAWNVEGITNMQNMFFRSGMPMADYDSLLIGWAAQDLQPGVSFNGGSSTYCAGASARANMIDTTAGDGWTISDGGNSVTASISGQDGFRDLGIDPVVTFVGSGGTAPYTFTYNVNGGSNMSVTSSGDTALVTQSSAIADTFTYNLVSVSDATGCIEVEIDNASTDIVAYLELRPFITTWETTAAGDSITIPTFPNETYNYTVDWGDGIIETNQSGDATHIYAMADTHTVSIYGDFPSIRFNNQGDKEKILTIEQWGDIVWTIMNDAYHGCSNLKITSEDAPDLSMVISLREMFRGATNFEGNIGAWNVEGIINMQNMFHRSGMPTADYDSLLIGWAAQDLQPGVSFNGGNSVYCIGAIARANMINTNTWSIIDNGGLVNAAAISNSPASSPLYSGDTLMLMEDIGGIDRSWSWTGPNGFVSTQQSPTIDSITTTESGLYTVVVTEDGCLDSESTEVLVYSPTASILGTATVCEGDASAEVTFVGSGSQAPYTFTYSLNGIISSISTTTGDTATLSLSTAVADSSYNYVLLSVTDDNGVMTSVTDSVLISIIPAPALLGNITGPSSVCPNFSSNITYTIPATPYGTNYVWTYSESSSIISGNGTNTISIDSIDMGGDLVVEITTDCGSVSDTITIAKSSPAICGLSDCSEVAITLDDAMLALFSSQDIFKAQQSIESSATITMNAVKEFRAGQEISMVPGFTVEQTATFLALIEACE